MNRFLRAGFWQKLLIAFILLLQIGLLVGVMFWIFSLGAADGPTAVIAIIVAIFVIDIIAAVYIINTPSPDIYRLTWMFVVFVLPLAGVLMYALFANKQTSRKNREKVAKYAKPIERLPSKKEDLEAVDALSPGAAMITKYLEACFGGGIHRRTSVEYFALTDFAYEPILRELRNAKHYIFLEFFIFDKGKFWNSILEILKQKAKEGLDVRVMYDDLGCLSTLPMRYDRELEAMGIKAKKFNPFRPLLDIRMNNRDHRKIMVIDGHTCFSGGFNIADEYINEIERFGHWKDNAILLRGEAVANFTYMFLANWVTNSDNHENIDKAYYSSDTFIHEIGGYPKDDGFAEPYGDIPFDNESVGERVYLSLIKNARKHVYITTPYLIIDKEMENALCHAAKCGVDVRLLTPHIPDKKAVFAVTRSYYGSLMQAGVRIYEYTPGFVHEKTFICDDEMATVGTFNLDYRSLFLHLECGTFLVGSSCIQTMSRDYLDTLALSHEVTMKEWKGWRRRRVLYWNLLRILGPFL